ncbi:MAG: hypothetical protein MI784_01980, partial [Cytophagales bacterium]|nr:hypothetical protein [Cytophagales bacterium]
WAAISARVADLPRSKQWRFGPDAMERFDDEERGFLARHLNDTKYIARLTRAYLGSIYGGGDEATRHVWVTPGRLTSDLRHAWGLDSLLAGHNLPDDPDQPARKNRDDHRHHAIDAIVVAVTDGAMLQGGARHARAQPAETDAERLLAGLPEPWEGFRGDVGAVLGRVFVSHKKEHGLAGALHEDTAYGVVTDPRGDGRKIVTRKAIADLVPNDLDRIGDDRIRRELLDATYGLSGSAFKAAVVDYAEHGRHKRVRLHRPLTPDTPLREIRHGPDGRFRKSVLAAENYCLDIVETAKGNWRCAGVSRFDANQGDGALSETFEPPWRRDWPDAGLVMRLRKNDLIAVEDAPGERRIMRVVRLEPSANRVRLAEHFEGGELQKRHEDRGDLFRWDLASVSRLKGRLARLVHVDPAGRVIDPGPYHAGTDRRGCE